MKQGDIVYIKAYKSMMGEIKEIDDMDRVTILLCDTGLEVRVNAVDIGGAVGNQPKRRDGATVSILGTTYTIRIIEENDYRAEREADGWLDHSSKEICIYNYPQALESVKDLIAYQNKVLRHEIVHAFLYESGLWQDSYGSKCWAKNEEMVDWIAIQEPKLHKAYKEVGCDE